MTWMEKMTFLDFIGDVGRLARVGTMLGRDSVKNRMDSPEGISFTEFTYQLLQAYDFWHLHEHHGCTVQLGGSDQWGNMVAGLDLIRRKLAHSGNSEDAKQADPAIAITLPLVTTATGEKFGKSAGNAVWLDEGLVSPFDFYQFFRRAPDSEVGRYLQYFTFLPLSDIESLLAQHKEAPQKHIPQRALAREVTELVHGETAATKAEIMSQVLYDGSIEDITAAQILSAFAGDARLKTLPRDSVVGHEVWEVAAASEAAKSRGQARKLQNAGGLYFNNVKVPATRRVIAAEDLVDGRVCLIRTGKENYRIVEVQ
ncbi:tyrosyl-tRNA synthetase [Rhizophlyctis rosea]|nr:tyrosyl-tRNA synthetase [Rhizophlyctis rosea]